MCKLTLQWLHCKHYIAFAIESIIMYPECIQTIYKCFYSHQLCYSYNYMRPEIFSKLKHSSQWVFFFLSFILWDMLYNCYSTLKYSLYMVIVNKCVAPGCKAGYAEIKNEIKIETNLSIFHDRLVEFHGKIGRLQKTVLRTKPFQPPEWPYDVHFLKQLTKISKFVTKQFLDSFTNPRYVFVKCFMNIIEYSNALDIS